MLTALGGCTFGVPIGDRGKQQSSGVPATTPSERGNPSSYVVFGKRYYVLDSSEGFVQRGIASWYGTKFHGRATSSGETYNMHAMTAAHKTLPIPVYVHVKNLDNGRSAVVKVNDRGPFISGRIIDLSYAAAKKLGVDGPGTANVNLEDDLPLFIQMGSFASQMNASNLMQNLLDANEKAVKISQLQTDAGLMYRVRVGPLFDIDEANAILLRLRDKGFQTARIVVEDNAE
jgi:rare lipoprotein A